MQKTQNNKAWFLVLPVLIMVGFSAILPLMTVVNYSVQEVLGPEDRFFIGLEWYMDTLQNEDLHDALFRQMIFSFCVLAIQIPLGVGISLLLPKKGWGVSFSLVVLALPLLIPWNVVGTIWLVFSRTDIGLGGRMLSALGINYNYTDSSIDAWATVLVMDIWHWLPLVILLGYAGLRAIPEAYYQAAKIDGASAWSIFRYIQFPKMKSVLVIAVLLRFMDSFMIYTEPFVLTGGGPGSSTTFLSQLLTQMAIGQFDLGPAAAFSIVYFLIILLISFVFYSTVMNQDDSSQK